jgi:hypothetical protein
VIRAGRKREARGGNKKPTPHCVVTFVTVTVMGSVADWLKLLLTVSVHVPVAVPVIVTFAPLTAVVAFDAHPAVVKAPAYPSCEAANVCAYEAPVPLSVSAVNCTTPCFNRIGEDGGTTGIVGGSVDPPPLLLPPPPHPANTATAVMSVIARPA